MGRVKEYYEEESMLYLERDPRVISFEMAKDRSSWGATIVHLTPA